MKSIEELSKLSQQELLRYAMNVLGFTRQQFAERIGTTRRALDNWLVPIESSENREMPEMARRFIVELLPADISLISGCPRCGWINCTKGMNLRLDLRSDYDPDFAMTESSHL